jgi:hypothetical protein
VLRERSLDTCAVYAPDMWPIIGLKSAVIVVGGSDTGEGEGENGEDVDGGGSVDDDDNGASGNVVNRMPVDTVRCGSADLCYISSCRGTSTVMKGHRPPALFSLALK